MADELVLRTTTDVAKKTDSKDILDYYDVPMLIDKVVEKERISFLDALGLGAGAASEIKHLCSEGRLVVEIPPKFRDAIKTGDATLIGSTKTPGNYTPNIKIEGQNGIAGQVTISEEKMQVSKANLANIAVMAMVQSVLGKLEAIEFKIDHILEGQRNDRIGAVIGAFKGFADLYPTFKTRDELVAQAKHAYSVMQIGLAQIHLAIDDDRKTLNQAPKNFWQVAKNAIKHFRRNDAEYYQNIYHRFIYNLQLYQRLLLLSDVVLLLTGDKNTSRQNHNVIAKYCNDRLDQAFERKMDFLTNHHSSEIKQVRENNTNFRNTLETMDKVPIMIEYKEEELKNIQEYGSEKG